MVIFFTDGSDGVFWYIQGKFPHICVVCGEQHTDVSGDPCKDDVFYRQMMKQCIQGCPVECGMLRFDEKIIVFRRAERGNDIRACFVAAFFINEFQICFPQFIVIIDIDNRMASFFTVITQVVNRFYNLFGMLGKCLPM